jgi:hypothetical protein
MQKIYVLKYGGIGRDGVIMEAFKTKTSFRKHIRLEYPEAKGRNRHKSNELYWEWGDATRVSRGGALVLVVCQPVGS